jgi:hypothetical protein
MRSTIRSWHAWRILDDPAVPGTHWRHPIQGQLHRRLQLEVTRAMRPAPPGLTAIETLHTGQDHDAPDTVRASTSTFPWPAAARLALAAVIVIAAVAAWQLAPPRAPLDTAMSTSPIAAADTGADRPPRTAPERLLLAEARSMLADAATAASVIRRQLPGRPRLNPRNGD